MGNDTVGIAYRKQCHYLLLLLLLNMKKLTIKFYKTSPSLLYGVSRKEGRKEGTCLFDINIKHNTEIYIGKIISGDSH